MLPILLILIPLLSGILAFFISALGARFLSLISSLATFGVALFASQHFSSAQYTLLEFDHEWISNLGARFTFTIDNGLVVLMILLTALVFPLLFAAILNKEKFHSSMFYGLMLLAQAGLMGVFLAKDALLFYLFWEVALIPVYFLSSIFGGERRIPVTFKFFVYTFVGSLIMLVAFLYIYQQLPTRSFSWDSFVSAGRSLHDAQQNVLFWMLFVAFAIKMPVFPFHTWQPDAYEQSATPVTVVLSAIMVKMGLFAVVRWLLPVVPDGSLHWMNVVIALSLVGIVYASCMAMVQDNIKRLIAYSSIAHIGLMSAALFSHTILGAQGVAVQMFHHGINIMGMWILVSIIENRTGTQSLKEMGGIAKVAPWFTISLVVISLANIALPLTNGFVGEFMMLNALFNAASPYRILFTVVAGAGVILSAVYTLGMIQKVAYGDTNAVTSQFKELTAIEKFVLIVIMLLILWLGFYPNAILGLVDTMPK